ncbi:Hypothetical predicted protein [Pelobates cultripes]|uniref:Uncharacterized protein n=1 Tax=Pelobates cultripes TaxID=61616 RepID=A0AAD1VWD3_PELCU|nr:Hypothetical predicted protein [Pelobates cultripes]
MEDLVARTQATENKMKELVETVQTHVTEIQELREQIRTLEEANEDLNNRTRRNNIWVRGLLEMAFTELLPDSLLAVFQHLLPEASAADLLMDRAHQA